MEIVQFDDVCFDRIVQGVNQVRQRMRSTVQAFDKAGIPYAVVGGNAVAAWVSTTNEGGVRNTPDVDLVVEREHFETAKQALTKVGFYHRTERGLEVFCDTPDASARPALRLLMAGERVRPDDLTVAVGMAETEFTVCEFTGPIRVASLEALVRMKLTSYRLKDQVHLQDMVQVGLIDDSWPARYIPELGERLQRILDDPEA